MKPILVLCLVFLPTLAWSQTPTAPAPTPTVDTAHAPKIFFSKPTFDFGNVDEGPDIVHEFHFRNKGKTTLKISNVSTSCGCTAAVESAKEIPPGGKGVIKATYHTSGRPGHATKFITVSSNDPSSPSFQLKLDMTVVRDIELQPDRVYLYGVQHGTQRETTIKVLGKPGVPLKVLSAQSSSGVVTVTSLTPYTDANEKRSGATLNVLLPSTQPIGTITDSIVLKTNNKKKPEVDIAVMGEVVGNIQFNPKSIYFTPHQDAPVTVQITATQSKGFTIREVTSKNHLVRPFIHKSSGPNGEDQYQLIATVLKDIPSASDGKDQIIMTTTDPDQPQLVVDVQASK